MLEPEAVAAHARAGVLPFLSELRPFAVGGSDGPVRVRLVVLLRVPELNRVVRAAELFSVFADGEGVIEGIVALEEILVIREFLCFSHRLAEGVDDPL